MGSADWVAVTRGAKCPICEHDHWCVVSRDGNAVICMRMEGGVKKIVFQRTGDVGHLFRLRDGPRPVSKHARHGSRQRPTRKLSSQEVERLHAEYRQRLRPAALHDLARRLGVGSEALATIDVGLLRTDVYAFPMSNGDGRMVGISFRAIEGQRWSEKGGRNGLFLPMKLYHEGALLIVEGPTDVAAVYGLGYDVIGRPSWGGCVDMLPRYCVRRDVVIVADDDPPNRQGKRLGYEGAVTVARSLKRVASSVKIITPVGAKDARDWVRLGADRELFDVVIENANFFRE